MKFEDYLPVLLGLNNSNLILNEKSKTKLKHISTHNNIYCKNNLIGMLDRSGERFVLRYGTYSVGGFNEYEYFTLDQTIGQVYKYLNEI